jgi:hypothetical protein
MTEYTDTNDIDPLYYADGIGTTDYILSKKLGWLEGNIIKYITRHKHKHGVVDLEKAQWYLKKLMEQYEKPKKYTYEGIKTDSTISGIYKPK